MGIASCQWVFMGMYSSLFNEKSSRNFVACHCEDPDVTSGDAAIFSIGEIASLHFVLLAMT